MKSWIAYDGNWDGDETGAEWELGYFITEQPDGFLLGYGDVERLSGNIIANPLDEHEGIYPSLQAAKDAASKHGAGGSGYLQLEWYDSVVPRRDDRTWGPDDDEDFDLDFADPGGRSALRASSADNPRNLPCPSCGHANRLTPKDAACGYQCDACADAAEGYGP